MRLSHDAPQDDLHKGMSLLEARDAEESFFAVHDDLKTLPKGQRGTPALASLLASLQAAHIQKIIPGLRDKASKLLRLK